MQNKNFYREFNKPISEKKDWETLAGGIMIGLVIVGFSLLSYGFWEYLFEIINQEKLWNLVKKQK